MKVVVAFLLLGAISLASEIYMLNFQMHTLSDKNKVVDLNSFKGKYLFLTFIKGDCEWCEKQLKAFNTLLKSEHSQEIQVVAATLGEDTKLLKAKTKEAEFPVLSASQELVTSIGGVEMTPYTLISDKKGNFQTKILGYQSADQIESIIHTLEGR